MDAEYAGEHESRGGGLKLIEGHRKDILFAVDNNPGVHPLYRCGNLPDLPQG